MIKWLYEYSDKFSPVQQVDLHQAVPVVEGKNGIAEILTNRAILSSINCRFLQQNQGETHLHGHNIGQYHLTVYTTGGP